MLIGGDKCYICYIHRFKVVLAKQYCYKTRDSEIISNTSGWEKLIVYVQGVKDIDYRYY